jgi:hypothetical protein
MGETLSERLQTLLDSVWKLRPSWQNPELFHEQKSEVVGQLKGLLAEAKSTPSSTSLQLVERANKTLKMLGVDTGSNGAATKPDADPTAPPLSVAVPASRPEQVSEAVAEQAQEPAQEPAQEATPEAPVIALAAEEAPVAAAEAPPVEAAVEQAEETPEPPATCAEQPPASPPENDPVTLYRRADLNTEAGRRIAGQLWAGGMSARQIADVFDFAVAAGASCVTAVVTMFLWATLATDDWSIDSADTKRLLRQTLGQTPVTTGTKASRDKSANLPVRASSVARQAPTKTPPPGATPYLMKDLETAEGRARATEMWIGGMPQREIGHSFGIPHPEYATARAFKAIVTFIERDCGIPAQDAHGEGRKRLARRALKQFHDQQKPTLHV